MWYPDFRLCVRAAALLVAGPAIGLTLYVTDSDPTAGMQIVSGGETSVQLWAQHPSNPDLIAQVVHPTHWNTQGQPADMIPWDMTCYFVESLDAQPTPTYSSGIPCVRVAGAGGSGQWRLAFHHPDGGDLTFHSGISVFVPPRSYSDQQWTNHQLAGHPMTCNGYDPAGDPDNDGLTEPSDAPSSYDYPDNGTGGSGGDGGGPSSGGGPYDSDDDVPTLLLINASLATANGHLSSIKASATSIEGLLGTVNSELGEANDTLLDIYNLLSTESSDPPASEPETPDSVTELPMEYTYLPETALTGLDEIPPSYNYIPEQPVEEMKTFAEMLVPDFAINPQAAPFPTWTIDLGPHGVRTMNLNTYSSEIGFIRGAFTVVMQAIMGILTASTVVRMFGS